MKILIVEDEMEAAWNLVSSIKNVEPQAEILGIADSISSTRDWLAQHEKPDLIFSDIQLGDGIVFDLYKSITLPCPVIFCTAYDEYLLQAFKSNGIDYLLKPIDDNELRKSFRKLLMLGNSLQSHADTAVLIKAITETLSQKNIYKTNFLVPHRDRLIPVEASQIMFFKVTDTIAEMGLMNGQSYHHTFTLDYLITVLRPEEFYRANRQYIVAYHGISEIEHYDDRKLLIHVKDHSREKIIVSKAKASDFLNWIQQR